MSGGAVEREFGKNETLSGIFHFRERYRVSRKMWAWRNALKILTRPGKITAKLDGFSIPGNLANSRAISNTGRKIKLSENSVENC